MKVELLSSTPIHIADIAIGKCWDKQKDYCDTERIERVANKNKHKSTIEHLVYNFDIDGISRACLQEVARHRIASYSVKSTRYTLKQLKYMEDDELQNCLVTTGNDIIDDANVVQLKFLSQLLLDGRAGDNDVAKYMLPEAFKTSLVMTINARSLQNFLELRLSKHALPEISTLALQMFNTLPEEHQFLFTDCFKGQ